MKEYCIYGGRLRSEVAFGELPAVAPGGREAAGDFACTFVRAEGEAGSRGDLLGEESIEGAGHLTLHRSDRILRLTHDRTGIYEIFPDRGLIEWHPSEPEPPAELLRSAVLTRVLPLLLHARGLFPLHASGVTVAAAAVGFAAPKGHGKSTLALAMASRGARLLSDDTLPLELGTTIRAWPGDQHIKVWDDAAEAVGASLPDRSPLASLSREKTVAGVEKRKYLLTRRDLTSVVWEDEPRPLEALYLLLPTPPDDAGTAETAVDEESDGREVRPERIRLSAIEAGPALVASSKVATLLHESEAGDLLDRATRLADEVAVYAIPVPRNLELIGDLCERIQRWHETPSDEKAAPGQGVR